MTPAIQPPPQSQAMIGVRWQGEIKDNEKGNVRVFEKASLRDIWGGLPFQTPGVTVEPVLRIKGFPSMQAALDFLKARVEAGKAKYGELRGFRLGADGPEGAARWVYAEAYYQSEYVAGVSYHAEVSADGQVLGY